MKSPPFLHNAWTLTQIENEAHHEYPWIASNISKYNMHKIQIYSEYYLHKQSVLCGFALSVFYVIGYSIKQTSAMVHRGY